MTYNIFTKAFQMLKERENYYEDQSSYDDTDLNEKECARAKAIAYHDARCILYYAMHESWEELDKLDYLNKENNE